MNVEEFKTRLEKAIAEAGGLPCNFWWAILQVVIELYSRQKIKQLEELKTHFKDYPVPMAIRKMLYNNWYSPACAEDLKIRAQAEAIEVPESLINALHQELHRMVGLTCGYKVWKQKPNLDTECRIVGFPTRGVEDFIDTFLYGKRTNDGVVTEYAELIEYAIKPFTNEVKGGSAHQC